jgi:hypothetical protein
MTTKRNLSRLLFLVPMVALASCVRAPQSAGGGVLQPGPGKAPIEVRGYVLTQDQTPPTDALGYAVPIFTSLDQAAQFCPMFTARLSMDGALTSRSKMVVTAYGQTVRIAPFIWPATDWPTGSVSDCKSLVQHYNLSGAKIFSTLATDVIRKNGGTVPDGLGDGPFIMATRRASGTVLLLDLSKVPPGDYQQWFDRAVSYLSDPRVDDTGYHAATLHDQVRFYVFGSIPDFMPVLNMLVPSFKTEHAKG